MLLKQQPRFRCLIVCDHKNDCHFNFCLRCFFRIGCVDTVGYVEAITGHTCQTYAEYGFCEEYKVVPGASIDVTTAEENCCVCGKL